MTGARRWLTFAVGILMVGMFGAVASAQSTQAQLTFVNGASAEPVNVVVNGDVVASDLEYATPSEPVLVDAGPATIEFSDGSSVELEVPGGTAWNVVSGHGEDDATAAAYPIVLAPIPEGQASSGVWNASTETVLVSLNGSDPGDFEPGFGVSQVLVDGGTVVSASAGVDTPALAEYPTADDNYVDFFVVDDGIQLAIATTVVPSMTDLIELLGGGVEPPPTAVVPDVAGLPADDATAALVEAGYNVGEVSEASDTVEAGLAIRTDPSAGTTTMPGITVALYISSGPATVEVPDVVGQPLDEAVAELEDLGFTTSIVEEESDEVEEGLVIETNPRAGVTVAPGTEIVVVVSTGPEDVEVPDFLGLTVDEANAVAEEAGLEALFVEDPDEPDPDGIVVAQDPAAGEVVPAGSEVVLQLSPATQDPWTSIKLDPNRFLTAGGINFLPESVSEIDVPESDIELRGRDVVDENGFWSVTIDTSRLDPNRAYDLVVTGTAEDGSPYEQIFTIPPVGETVDEPQEDEAVPTWVWFVLGGILIAAIVIGVVLLTGAGSSGSEAADAGAGNAEASVEPSPEEPS